MNRTYFHIPQTVSTNEDVKNRIRESGLPLYDVISADCQTGGKGRLGRHFFSPPGGLYVSVAYPLAENCKNPSFLTLTAGRIVAGVIDALCLADTKIKWPNDIYLDGKKICGILTESIVKGDTITAVVGIGINLTVKKEDIPPELRHKMASLCSLHYPVPDKEILVKRIVSELDGAVYEKDCLNVTDEAAVLYLNRKSLLTGREVTFSGGTGKAKEITPDGSLRVMLPSGEDTYIKFGEVTTGNH